jgi:hypothetical protein
MPVPIVLDYADGRSVTVDLVVHERVTDATMPLDGVLRRARVDRDATLARW